MSLQQQQIYLHTLTINLNCKYIKQYSNLSHLLKMLENQQLYKHIPKTIQKWTYQDICLWFQLNSIIYKTTTTQPQLKHPENKVNQQIQQSSLISGKQLLDVDPQYLSQHFNITSKIIIRSILDWLHLEAADYDQYVQDTQKKTYQIQILNSIRNQKIVRKEEFMNAFESQKVKQEKEIYQEKEIHKEKEDKEIEKNKQEKEINKENLKNNQAKEIQHILYHSEKQYLSNQNQKKQHAESIIPYNSRKYSYKDSKNNSNEEKQQHLSLQNIPEGHETNQQQQPKSSQSLKLIKSIYERTCKILIVQHQENIFKINSEVDVVNKIGRNSNNQVIIINESVSRHHAEIIKIKKDHLVKNAREDPLIKNSKEDPFIKNARDDPLVKNAREDLKWLQKDEQEYFYIKDIGSKFGTMVEIGLHQSRPLEEGDILYFGDNCLEIIKLKVSNDLKSFEMKVIKRNLQNQDPKVFYKRTLVTIGRKGKDISFPDQEIQNNHANISLLHGKVFLVKGDGESYLKLAQETLWKIEGDEDQEIKIRLGMEKIIIKYQTLFKETDFFIK